MQAVYSYYNVPGASLTAMPVVAEPDDASARVASAAGLPAEGCAAAVAAPGGDKSKKGATKSSGGGKKASAPAVVGHTLEQLLSDALVLAKQVRSRFLPHSPFALFPWLLIGNPTYHPLFIGGFSSYTQHAINFAPSPRVLAITLSPSARCGRV